MIRPEYFIDTLGAHDIDFFAGVPDSLLKNICAYCIFSTMAGTASARG